MIFLKYKSENGDSVEFMPKQILPLSYDDLFLIFQKENTVKIEGTTESFELKKGPFLKRGRL